VRFERRRSFGGFRDRESSDLPKPVKAGEEYDVEVTEVGAKGDGIARVNNFVVFISDVKKGDKVKIKIKEVRDRFATGEKAGAAEAKAETAEAKTETAEAKAEVKPVAEAEGSEEAELDTEEEEETEEASEE